MNDEDPDVQASLALQRACDALPRELPPARDLWPGIERRIAQLPRRGFRWRQRLLVTAVAASFLMATASLLLVLSREPRNLVESFERVNAEYLPVRERLLASFARRHAALDPGILQPVYRNLDIIDGARLDLEAAVRADPRNQRLLELLIRLQQQEIEILQQNYAFTPASI